MLSQPQVRPTRQDNGVPCVDEECVFFDPAGQSGAGVQAEQSGGRHLHGVSTRRRQQLCGGERGRLRLHGVSPRQVSDVFLQALKVPKILHRCPLLDECEQAHLETLSTNMKAPAVVI